MVLACSGRQMVATRYQFHSSEAPVVQQHRRRLVGRQADRLVQQRLVRHHLAAARARVGADDHLRLRVLDARGQRAAGEAAEHHAVDGADACAGQHREGGLRDHGHVDEHAVAALHAQFDQHRRRALHLGVQFAKGIAALAARLGRDRDERRLLAALGQVPVDRVVAQVGLAAHEPAAERRPAGVQDLRRRLVPVDQAGLLGPEGFGMLQGAAVEFGVAGHAVSCRSCGAPARGCDARGHREWRRFREADVPSRASCALRTRRDAARWAG